MPYVWTGFNINQEAANVLAWHTFLSAKKNVPYEKSRKKEYWQDRMLYITWPFVTWLVYPGMFKGGLACARPTTFISQEAADCLLQYTNNRLPSNSCATGFFRLFQTRCEIINFEIYCGCKLKVNFNQF